MTEPEIYAFLHETFADLFMRDDITLTAATAAADVEGWDSFKQIEIIMACEEKFGFKFRTQDLDSMQSVGDLVRLILAH